MKSEAKSSKDLTPRLRIGLSPAVTPLARVWEVGLAMGHFIMHDEEKRMGPSNEPCQTPTKLPTFVSSQVKIYSPEYIEQ